MYASYNVSVLNYLIQFIFKKLDDDFFKVTDKFKLYELIKYFMIRYEHINLTKLATVCN